MAGSAPLHALGISGSPSATSRSRALVALALERIAASGATTRLIDLGDLPADGLLGRTQDAAVAGAVEELGRARILVVGTPIYRATYTGLLKVFFDLLAADSLRGSVTLPIATGGGPAHLLMIDHGIRPLIASLGGLTTAAAIYATPTDFDEQAPGEALRARLDLAADEALALAAALASVEAR